MISSWQTVGLIFLICFILVIVGIRAAERRGPSLDKQPHDWEVPPVQEAPAPLPPAFKAPRRLKVPKVKYAAIRQLHRHDQEEAEAHG